MGSKVGIVTFHNGSNFGAALQTYALQEVVKKLGFEVKIVNYDNHFISDGLNLFNVKLSEEKELRRQLCIKDSEKIAVVIAAGYYQDENLFLKSKRRKREDIFFYR